VEQGHPVRTVLRILEIERSTYYAYVNKQKQEPMPPVPRSGRPAPGYSYTQEGKPVSDGQISEWIMELLEDEGPTSAYGYRKLTVCLKRQHQLIINKKKVYRLCKKMGVLRRQRKLKTKHPRRLANNRILTGSNQLWETDVKYGWIGGEQRFFFLMCILDVFDRAIIAYHIGLNCEAKHLVQITQEALMKRQLFDNENKPVIRSDNGPQFISHLFETTCDEFGMIHERIPPKTPNKNAHIESFHAIVEQECYQRHEFETYPQAYEIVAGFITSYNQERIHGSLYDLPPYSYMAAVQNGTIKAKEVKV
jgi:putative transposase